MFNNYNLEPEFMMDYNAKKGIYEKALYKTKVYELRICRCWQ
jgi:hypothetical protein